MTTTLKNLPTREQRGELSKKARAFYEPLRGKLEKEHWGEYITIHPENGDYAVSPSHWEAVKAMHAKYPEVLFYTIRIGYRAFAHRRHSYAARLYHEHGLYSKYIDHRQANVTQTASLQTEQIFSVLQNFSFG